MPVKTQRYLINIVDIENPKRNQMLDESNEFCFYDNIIQLPQDKKLYSSPSIIKYLNDLFSEGQMDTSLYSDNDFHKDMQLISKLHPNLIFCIEVVVSEYMKMHHEYYLNGKIIEDRGWFNLYYDGFEFEYNPNQMIRLIDSSDWKDILDSLME